jgi:cytochrome c5
VKTLNQVNRIALWAFVVLVTFAGASFAAKSVSMSDEAILDRIKPVGMVTVSQGGGAAADASAATDATSGGARSGADIVKASCQACHMVGVAGAPKIGNSAEWGARAEKGIDGMLQISISGKNAMPPRGTCGDCSDDELKLAIEHMLKESGL